MENLKECPFCKNKKIEIIEKIEYGCPKTFEAKCTNCFAIGPFGYNEKEAIENWNRR